MTFTFSLRPFVVGSYWAFASHHWYRCGWHYSTSAGAAEQAAARCPA